MTCSSSLPWPCEHDVAGGTHALGAVLCPRHLAAILAPQHAPDLDRNALRKRFVSDRSKPALPDRAPEPLDAETLAAIIALAPLGATVTDSRRRYRPTGSSRMPAGRPGGRWRPTTADDPCMPRNARSAARKAEANGWAVRVTVVDDLIAEHVQVKCTRGDDLVTLGWQDGSFSHGWSLGRGQLEQLGFRAAGALIALPYAQGMEATK